MLFIFFFGGTRLEWNEKVTSSFKLMAHILPLGYLASLHSFFFRHPIEVAVAASADLAAISSFCNFCPAEFGGGDGGLSQNGASEKGREGARGLPSLSLPLASFRFQLYPKEQERVSKSFRLIAYHHHTKFWSME